jgi:hypothetical protein
LKIFSFRVEGTIDWSHCEKYETHEQPAVEVSANRWHPSVSLPTVTEPPNIPTLIVSELLEDSESLMKF